MKRDRKKEGGMLKKIVLVLIVLVVALLAFSFYLGMFRCVSIEKGIAGPYQIACLDHIGPYKDIYKKIQGVKKLLDEQKIVTIDACGIYYDDPKSVSSDKLRSKGGYIIEGKPKVDIAEKMDIPEREVIIAKVKAHPAIAAIRIYPKINKCLIINNFIPAGPCLEIYHKNGIVEVQMPISPKKGGTLTLQMATEKKEGTEKK